MRPLRIIIDSSALADDSVDPLAREYLKELLELETFESFTLAQDANDPRIPERHLLYGAVVADGWIIPEESARNGRSFVWVEAGTRHVTTVGCEYPIFPYVVTGVVPPSFRPYGEPRRLQDDIAAVRLAKAMGADLLITHRPLLVNGPLDFEQDTALRTVSSAIPLLGLYLRLSGRYVLRYPDPQGDVVDKWLFFQGTTTHLLPSLRDWRLTINQDDEENSIYYNLHALMQRMAWALATRDEVLAALSTPITSQTSEDTLYHITQMLLWIVGAFDAAALVVRRVYKLAVSERTTGWQHRQFQKQLNESAPSIASMMSPGSPGYSVLQIAQDLRNCIHGEALRVIDYTKNSNPRVGIINVPPSRQKTVLDVINHLGDPEKWGVEDAWPSQLHLYPGPLMESLLTETFRTFESLLSTTRLAHLTNTASPPTASNPPSVDWYLLTQSGRDRALMQLGLYS